MAGQVLVVDQAAPLWASLGICAFLVAMFWVHAWRGGALKKLGRKPMTNREFFGYGAMSMIPPMACLASLWVCMLPGAMELPALLAVGMVACACAGHFAMSALARMIMAGQES